MLPSVRRLPGESDLDWAAIQAYAACTPRPALADLPAAMAMVAQQNRWVARLHAAEVLVPVQALPPVEQLRQLARQLLEGACVEGTRMLEDLANGHEKLTYADLLAVMQVFTQHAAGLTPGVNTAGADATAKLLPTDRARLRELQAEQRDIMTRTKKD